MPYLEDGTFRPAEYKPQISNRLFPIDPNNLDPAWRDRLVDLTTDAVAWMLATLHRNYRRQRKFDNQQMKRFHRYHLRPLAIHIIPVCGPEWGKNRLNQRLVGLIHTTGMVTRDTEHWVVVPRKLTDDDIRVTVEAALDGNYNL